MMQVGANVFHRIDPQLVNPLDVGARQVRRVRAERETLDLLVLAQHDEPRREIRIVRRAIPRLAEQDAPGRSGVIIADSPTTISLDLQLHGRLRHRVEDVGRRRDEQLRPCGRAARRSRRRA